MERRTVSFDSFRRGERRVGARARRSTTRSAPARCSGGIAGRDQRLVTRPRRAELDRLRVELGVEGAQFLEAAAMCALA